MKPPGTSIIDFFIINLHAYFLSLSSRKKKGNPAAAGLGSLIFLVGLVYLLNHPMGSLPALGRLIDPVNGCWANAESVNKNFTLHTKFPGINSASAVWFDDRLVPHIHAGNDHDVYFLEGYIHAYFRLWQMDMETRAAAGRIAEILGPRAVNYDRRQRRIGMIYAAENSLRAMEADPRSKILVDAYTEGINYYISTLCYRGYPLEYKLMGFAPEKWTTLKVALMSKFMADDLTGRADDISLSYLKTILSPEIFDLLYPETIEGSSPVIPSKTVFEKPSLKTLPVPPDSLFAGITGADFGEKKEDGKGSNNWAISGSRTQSGATILCNDPHLKLVLPSLWFEMQLQAPGMNVYGASLPGTPGIVIGLNDSVTWGCTNNYRDVKDYYIIKPVAQDNNKYWFAGRQLEYAKRIERIAIKGQPDLLDTVDYTIHGPVMYDSHFAAPGGFKKPLAMCWMGHRGSNELLAIYLLDRAQNYKDYVDAISNYQCPAQNFIYADRVGNIALWGQGQFINKWHGQGRFIMDGSDSAMLWKELIPMNENPHALNPAQGYLASANQCVTDSTYPYWYNGYFVEFRSWRINQVLSGLQKATIQDMFNLQQDTYSILAEKTLPVLLKYVREDAVAAKQQKYIDALAKWDYNLSSESYAAMLYQRWWRQFHSELWSGLKNVPDNLLPLPERTMQLMLSDTAVNYTIGNKTFHERLKEAAVHSFAVMIDTVEQLYAGKQPVWYSDKNTTVQHLAKLPAFSYDHLKVGGWGNTVNAVKSDHGPSWRMVVQMGKEIEGYCVYPGGQSGNPGSKYYATFLQNWTDGHYYRMQFLPNTDKQENNNIKYTWTIGH